jgi:osmotically inducible protein OsmC
MVRAFDSRGRTTLWEEAMKRLATAIWKGGPRAGEGTVSTASGVFSNVLFTASPSHEEFPCTCPSEMLAAAAGSCVSLMVAKELAAAKIHPEHVRTDTELEIVESARSWKILGLKMKVRVGVGELDEAEFHKAIKRAKQGCAISNVLSCPVSVDVEVEKAHAIPV